MQSLKTFCGTAIIIFRPTGPLPPAFCQFKWLLSAQKQLKPVLLFAILDADIATFPNPII
jgi:hypothetical protein